MKITLENLQWAIDRMVKAEDNKALGGIAKALAFIVYGEEAYKHKRVTSENVINSTVEVAVWDEEGEEGREEEIETSTCHQCGGIGCQACVIGFDDKHEKYTPTRCFERMENIDG